MSQFKKISIKEIKKETSDTVSISFDIPAGLSEDFNYKSGQYITLKANIEGEEVRRAYSLCSAPSENDFRIGVKKVENGRMSSYLNDVVKAGDEIEVMVPAGNFCLADGSVNVVGVAAGSGITPVISIMKTTLKGGGDFTLFYGSKEVKETIFKICIMVELMRLELTLLLKKI